MIKLYTIKMQLKDRTIIDDINIFFDNYITEEKLTKKDKLAIREIDKKTIIDLYHLSVDCKAIILMLHLKNSCVISIEALGDNGIDYVLDKLDEISLYSKSIVKIIKRIKDEHLRKEIVYNENVVISKNNLNDFYFLI